MAKSELRTFCSPLDPEIDALPSATPGSNRPRPWPVTNCTDLPPPPVRSGHAKSSGFQITSCHRSGSSAPGGPAYSPKRPDSAAGQGASRRPGEAVCGADVWTGAKLPFDLLSSRGELFDLSDRSGGGHRRLVGVVPLHPTTWAMGPTGCYIGPTAGFECSRASDHIRRSR